MQERVERQSTYIGPTDHIYRRQVHVRENGVLVNLVGDLLTQDEADQAETDADGAVFTAQRVVCNLIEYHVFLAEFGLETECIDVVLVALHKSPYGERICTSQEALLKAEYSCS